MKRGRKAVLSAGIGLAFIALTGMACGCSGAKEQEEVSVTDPETEPNEDASVESFADEEDMTPAPVLGVIVGDNFFSIYAADNSSADAFIEEVSRGNVRIDMHDYGNFEKVGDLPWDLPTNDEEITTRPGDVILYQGNKITIYYDENTWNFTKLGHINATPEEIKETFGGKEDITAEFFVEWTE